MTKLIDSEKLLKYLAGKIKTYQSPIDEYKIERAIALEDVQVAFYSGTFDPTPVQPDTPKPGDTVRHKTYGIGIVIDADDHIATVNFDGSLEIPFLHELEVIK